MAAQPEMSEDGQAELMQLIRSLEEKPPPEQDLLEQAIDLSFPAPPAPTHSPTSSPPPSAPSATSSPPPSAHSVATQPQPSTPRHTFPEPGGDR